MTSLRCPTPIGALLITVLMATTVAISAHQSSAAKELAEADSLTSNVVQLFSDQKFDEALASAQRALEIRRRLLPANDPRIELNLNYVGEIYLTKGESGKAKSTFEELLSRVERRLGADDIGIADVLDRLAPAYFRSRDFKEAELAYRRALTIREAKLVSDSIEVANSLYAIGDFYRARKDFDKGAEFFKRAMQIAFARGGFKSAEYQRAQTGFLCMAYENERGPKEISAVFRDFTKENSLESLGILNGKAIRLPKPVFPFDARQGSINDIVAIKIKVDEKGQVIEAIDMCQGRPNLVQASLASARNALFEPTLKDGKPIKKTGILVYRFMN